ncbi:MAG: hypothetical protein Fur0043_08060 [Anaerolineales bacterium]
MKRRILIPSLVFLALLALAVTSVSASSLHPGLLAGPEAEGLVPGNYCASCHLADDPRLASVTAWNGGIQSRVNSPCPAATKVHEELYYTERLLLMIQRAEDAIGPLPEKTQARLDGYTQRYSRMLDMPVTSLDAFVSEAQATRYQLNKVYSVLNQMAQDAKGRTVLMIAAIITLIVLGSLAWGVYNSRALASGSVSKSWGLFWRILFVLAVLAFFVLPLFRVPAEQVMMTTAEQQAAQTTLDTAQRAADAADRAQARAWMLARVAAAYADVDAAQAQSILDEALASLETARKNETALWGQSLVVQEVTVGTKIEMESAGLITADLNAARARAWALPLVAREWNALDPEKAVALLLAEQETVMRQSGPYRDLQLRALSLAWANVNASKAAPTAAKIDDAAIRAWTLRELAALTNNPSLYEKALQAAREIEDPVQKARALREIAQASGKSALFDEALAALEGVKEPALSYALSDLAAASGNASLVERIAYPDARASALLRMGEYQAAWDAASAISDPFEQARAQAAIAAAWADADAAVQITVPLYRDLALRDVIRNTGNASLVDSMISNYYKTQAFTALGDYQAALQAASDLTETYPLVELAVSLAKSDPQAALALVEQMGRESDKAVALRALAAASGDPTLIQKAQGMALAARVRNDALAPAQVSLDLAQAFWNKNSAAARAALKQAYEAAQRIATK